MNKRILAKWISLVCLIGALSIIPQLTQAQDDLMNMLQDATEDSTEINYTTATFKTTRIVTGHSIELPAAGVLQFLIGHRFGRLNAGPYEFFGLDQATMRLGFEYGVLDRLTVGVGRSTFEKTFDGFGKYKLLRQSTGGRKMPVSLVYFTSVALNSLRWAEPERENFFSSRLSYTHQLLLARKINDGLSLQLTPTYVHHNLVPTTLDKNDIYAMGAGFRQKITKSITINGEYFYLLPDQVVTKEVFNSASLGIDIETGGHVFQLHVSNSRAMIEKMFITETTGDITNGDIHFGFNISRVFTLKRKDPAEKKKW